MNLLKIWRATFVRRWHTNADLHDSGDMQHGHAGRMGVMALALWPAEPDLACACMMHDMGEGGDGPGDVPGPAKAANDTLATALRDLESAAILRLGLPQSADKDPRVHLLDRLDAYLWVTLKAPHLTATDEWRQARRDIHALTMPLDTASRDAICNAILEATHHA